MRDFPVKVKMPNRKSYMNANELANWANAVCRKGSGKAPFQPSDYPERLKGHHCDCGVDENGYTKGVFTLRPPHQRGGQGRRQSLYDLRGVRMLLTFINHRL